jgi:hypothetical protein
VVLRSDAVSGKPDVQHTLKTLRYKHFANAGYITKDSRKKIINLAVAMRGNENGLMGYGIDLKRLHCQ